MSDINDVHIEAPRYFFSPWVDFMTLGGGSLIVLTTIALLIPKEVNVYFIAFTLWMAHFINHPHFAHSYQIFYSNFLKKLLSAEYPFGLRLGYWFSGVAVPLILIIFFAANFFFGNNIVLGLAINLMFFLVGWHYVKQGYGILMADAALKKIFFSSNERNILIANAYACWFATWVYANQVVRDKQFFYVHYYTFDAPAMLVYLLVAFFVFTSVLVVGMVCARLAAGKGIPFNGVVAYMVSLYMWLVFVGTNPLFVFIVPAFHSLQYLIVVWRYRINYAKAKKTSAESLKSLPFGRFFNSYIHYQMTIFIGSGLLLGYFGFWGIPYFLSDVVAFDRFMWGSSIFVVMCWVFINVHHYFIDSVMWRKTNKDVFQHLFSNR